MKTSTILSIILLLVACSALAEDGDLFVRNISKTADDQTSFATMKTFYTYVPAIDTDDVLVDIPYFLKDTEEETITTPPPIEEADFTRAYARPLIAFYHDGPLVHLDKSGDASVGHRDVFGAVSMDDGNTWKRTNLSDHAYDSSFRLDNGFNYPGDTYRLFAASHGTKVIVAWASRYCKGGNPTYAMPEENLEGLRDYLENGLEIDGVTFGGLFEDLGEGVIDQAAMYTVDRWGIAGSQGSHDYTEDGFPEVGELPYCSLWVARGTLEDRLDDEGNVIMAGEEPAKAIVWRKAERLTSGLRDVHRIECGAAKGAGFVITWQEDPEGLRPGEGEGPGEGWSGAVAHHQTDIWYSFIDWNSFDLIQGPETVTVEEDDGTFKEVDAFDPITLTQYYEESTDENGNPVPYDELGVPAVGVPFSIPVRITDNAMGHALVKDELTGEDRPYDADLDGPNYLFEDFNNDGTADFCAETVTVTIPIRVNNGDPVEEQTEEFCITEDGRLLRGNIAATRARVNLRGYNAGADDDGVNESAWVIMAYEESKGLGEDEDLEQVDGIKVDMGKNIWYHTFDMFHPEVISQGLNLNGPAPYPDDVAEYLNDLGVFYDDNPDALPWDPPVQLVREARDGHDFMTIYPDPIYESEAGMTNTILYQHEIARRFSLISQEVADINVDGEGLAAFAMFKQGIVRQGGPADIFARRFVVPEDWDPTTDNPFDYSCIECNEWRFTTDSDGISNPRYVKGLCMDQAMNISASTRTQCDGSEPCEQVFPHTGYFDDADLSQLSNPDWIYYDADQTTLERTSQWVQNGPDFGGALSAFPAGVVNLDDVTPINFGDEYEAEGENGDYNNFDDASWENAFEVAKGHRGFLKGDYLLTMYAWSPNWLANSVGHDNYNLYIRRSFDGGKTFTTLPSADYNGGHAVPEGVTITTDETADFDPMYEWMGRADSEDDFAEYKVYWGGDADTPLAPGAFEPARDLSLLSGTKLTVLDPRFCPAGLNIATIPEGLEPADEIHDPSKFFITFEVGDNTTVEFGEAEPLDMYYSRATNWGDDYDVVDQTEEEGYVEETDNQYYFDWLENKKQVHAAEAAVFASPGGQFFYAIWNQWEYDALGEETNSDAMMRRWYWNTDDTDEDGTDPGGGGGGGNNDRKPPKGPTNVLPDLPVR